MKVLNSWGEFLEEIKNKRNCIVYISKMLDKIITRKRKEELDEIKSLLRIKKIKIKVVTLDADNYKENWKYPEPRGGKYDN